MKLILFFFFPFFVFSFYLSFYSVFLFLSFFYFFSFLILFFLKEFFLIIYFILCMSALSAYTPVCQKRASDLSIDGCESPCGSWELNLGPLKEQCS
jgi:hypothetical protein